MSTSNAPANGELRDRVLAELLSYVRQTYFGELATEINYGTPLLQLGIIDSLSMMSFIMFLEERYGLDFMKVEIMREDFRSIEVLADVVINNIAAPAPAAGAGGEAVTA